jgi:hypothetical protein
LLVNLTPHDIHLYGWDVPEVFAPGEHKPVHVIARDGKVARLGEIDAGTQRLDGVEVELVEYRSTYGLPDPEPDVWFIVSLVTALAARGRHDLLVPFRELRDRDGRIIGARILARPI